MTVNATKPVDITKQPLAKRKAALTKIFTPAPVETLLVVQSIPEEGVALFQHVLDLKLEGLVGKRVGSIYLPGERTLDWRKIKRKGAVPAERFKR